jgi:hypothetical protein
MPRHDLVVNGAVRYRPPGPGLQRHRDGLLLEVLERVAVIKPARPRDAAPVQVPGEWWCPRTLGGCGHRWQRRGRRR